MRMRTAVQNFRQVSQHHRILLKIVVIVLIPTFLTTSEILAHEGATGVVKERMESMKSVAQSMKRINKALRSNSNVDRAAIKREAAAITRRAREFPQKFPAGSEGGVSEAKPEVWQNPVDFSAKSMALATAAERLSSAAGTGSLKELSAGFSGIGKTCGACHRVYRMKKRNR